MIPDEEEVTVPDETTQPDVKNPTEIDPPVSKVDDVSTEKQELGLKDTNCDLPSKKPTTVKACVTVVFISMILSAIWVLVFVELLKLMEEYALI